MTQNQPGQARTVEALLSAIGARPPEGVFGDAVVTAITDDSRQVAAGSVFVAIPGTVVDGRRFLGDVAERGALFAVTEPPIGGPAPLPVVSVESARRAVALLAHAFHGWPTRSMQVVGVTGTNGKTSMTYLLEALMAAAGKTPAVVGTVEGRLGARRWPALTTTPNPVALAAMTVAMRADGADALAIEVSSHAIDQHRVAGIAFDAGIFTNLSQDHLDYHGTMEAYAAVKRRFFTEILAACPGARAVVNIDEPLGVEIAGAFDGPVITWGRQAGSNVRIVAHEAVAPGMRIELSVLGEAWTLTTPLVGWPNVLNVAAAVAWAQSLEIDRETIQRGLSACARIPGRLETVDAGQPFRVIIDYSHTPASLEGALRTCRDLVGEGARLAVVFGCGGDRDAIKRPIMGEIAARGADRIFLTSDNPRTEDPAKIARDATVGVEHALREAAGEFVTELDRRAAIHAALSKAAAGDVVLIAGKGHETYQEIHGERLPFDDAEVARAWLRERAS